MDILPLLDELQIIARNGLNYAQNPYDRERYERLMELTKRYYGEALDLPPAAVRERLSKELGYVTRRLGPMRRSSTRLGDLAGAAGRRPVLVPALRLGRALREPDRGSGARGARGDRTHGEANPARRCVLPGGRIIQGDTRAHRGRLPVRVDRW